LSTSELLPGLLLHIGNTVKFSVIPFRKNPPREARGSVNPAKQAWVIIMRKYARFAEP